MRVIATLALCGGLGLLLPGCIARTAIDVVTLPVKAAGGAVDAATTSQSEADEKRGRALRKREERLGKLERRRRDLQQDCARGDDAACAEMDEVDAEIRSLTSEPN